MIKYFTIIIKLSCTGIKSQREIDWWQFVRWAATDSSVLLTLHRLPIFMIEMSLAV